MNADLRTHIRLELDRIARDRLEAERQAFDAKMAQWVLNYTRGCIVAECAWCGQSFGSRRADAEFHSVACRVAAHRDREHETRAA
jgi:hypothetical protein